ncbi:MAG: enoyl-CoA hydratase/isomerase family protein [Betaproteobacteria bacterium]|nr:enoyl-CoA hydratase/isomerase family protein [Betaproteobacteria bacterium]
MVAAAEVGVRLERLGPGMRVAWVTLENAARANSMNRALMSRFQAVLAGLADDESLQALVLTGAGERAFVGGADIGEMSALDVEGARAFITEVHRCCEAVRRFPAPVIARINGVTLGAGLELAAACDLRVAVQGARFGMPEVHLGIPSVVEAALLPHLVGWGRAREMLLLGEVFDAAQALQWGLLERVVPEAELDSAVAQWLASLAKGGTQALRTQKRLMLAWENLPRDEAITAGVDAFASSYRSGEPTRMMAAFLAARAAAKTRGG